MKRLYFWRRFHMMRGLATTTKPRFFIFSVLIFIPYFASLRVRNICTRTKGQSYSVLIFPERISFGSGVNWPYKGYLVNLRVTFSRLCSTRAQGPLAPNFCSWLTGNSYIPPTNHILGTLDFTCSEHWASPKFA